MLTCLILSCNKSNVFLHNFEKNTWEMHDSVIFEFNISNIDNPYRLSFFFRNNLNYPYRNIFLFAETHDSLRVIKKDTVQYLVSDKYGKWLGRGFGKNRDNYFDFQNSIKFEHVGKHKIIIQHGMRERLLKGVVSIGFEIEEK